MFWSIIFLSFFITATNNNSITTAPNHKMEAQNAQMKTDGSADTIAYCKLMIQDLLSMDQKHIGSLHPDSFNI